MFCTAGLVVSWALTVSGVPAHHPKSVLSCYPTEEQCLDGKTAANNVMALQQISYRPARIACEREPAGQ
jgi:hypothetical protein